LHKILAIWICTLVLFGAVLLFFPHITSDLSAFDRYAFEAQFQDLMDAGEFDAAKKLALLALALNSHDIPARYSLGEALERTGDVAGASREFRRAAKLIERHHYGDVQDRSREYRFWLRYHATRGEWFEALSAYYLLPEEAIEAATDEFRRDVLKAAVETRCWSAVVELTEEDSLEAMMPDDGSACLEFAQTCENAGKNHVAESAFAKAADAGVEMGALRAGLLALQRGDGEQAERFFERAPAGYRDYGLARVHHAFGRVREANELYKKALAVHGSDIEWLCDGFDAAEKAGDTEQIERILAAIKQLEPTFRRRYELNPRLVFAGMGVKSPWLSGAGYLDVTFFWHVSEPRSAGRLVVLERSPQGMVAQVGETVFQKATLRNLLPEPGLETGGPGERYPLGFAKAVYYGGAPHQSQVVTDEHADHDGDQCLRMAGIGRQLTSCALSRPWPVSAGTHYMLGGQLRTRGGDAQMACVWLDGAGKTLPTETTGIRAHERMQWRSTSTVVRSPYRAKTCSVRIANWKSEGQSFFDDVFFIEVPIRRSMLNLL
jgi:Flp pilus assembly protein TadD